MDGMILKIDRGSRHDGPGIRTVIFLKGCPLRCVWCSTPESQETRPHLLHMESLCVRCGRCAAHCPEQALSLSEDGIVLDHARCTLCGACVEHCLQNAMKITGGRMSLEEVYDIIKRTRCFWARMPGGITISGGEALFQFDFTLALLKKCHDAGIDTNIETSCFAPEEKIRALLPYLDHACCDVKHMDEARHRDLTGVSNAVIKENIRLISHEKDLILRYPVIPGCNDSQENVDDTIAFIKTLGPRFNRIDLLRYHNMGAVTYHRLGRAYALEGVEALSTERMEAIRERMRQRGVNAHLA